MYKVFEDLELELINGMPSILAECISGLFLCVHWQSYLSIQIKQTSQWWNHRHEPTEGREFSYRGRIVLHRAVEARFRLLNRCIDMGFLYEVLNKKTRALKEAANFTYSSTGTAVILKLKCVVYIDS